MSRFHVGSVLVALMTLSWATMPSIGAPSDDDCTESTQSDARVALTLSLQQGGMELPLAHEIVLLATDGVLLDEEEQICTVYMITLFWCETHDDGSSSNMMMHLRMDESCFDTFFPSGGVCLGMACLGDARRMYRMTTSNNYCYGIPKNTCVFATITGPVQSTCDSLPDCDCLPDLDEETCSTTEECVPVVPTVQPDLVVPTECPECD